MYMLCFAKEKKTKSRRLYTREKYSLPYLARWLHLMIRANKKSEEKKKRTQKMALEQRGKYISIYIILQWNNKKKKNIINKRQTITKFKSERTQKIE
jgi:hypothetical protein